MTLDVKLALVASGFFLLVGLYLGAVFDGLIPA